MVYCCRKPVVVSMKSGVPIDRGWAWMVVLGGFVGAMCMIGVAKSLGMFMVEIQRRFDIPMVEATMIFMVAALFHTICVPMSMSLGERFGTRRVVMCGGFIGFVGISLSSLAFNNEYIVVMFGLFFGIGNSCIYGNCLVTVGNYFQKRRSFAAGLMVSGGSFGQFVMPLLLEYSFDQYGLEGTLLLTGAVYFHVVSFGALLRPLSFYQRPHCENHNLGDGENIQCSEQKPCLKSSKCSSSDKIDNDMVSVPNNNTVDDIMIKEREDLIPSSLVHNKDSQMNSTNSPLLVPKAFIAGSLGSMVLTSMENIPQEGNNEEASCPQKCMSVMKTVWRLWDFSMMKDIVCLHFIIVNGIIFFGVFNLILFFPAYAVSVGITDYEKAVLVSIAGGGDLVGRILIGFVGDLNLCNRYKLMASMVIVNAINTFVFPFTKSFSVLCGLTFIHGFSAGCEVSLMAVVLIDFFGLAVMSKCLAVIMFFQGSAVAFGQPFLGWIKDVTESYDAVFFITGSAALIGGILLLLHPLVVRLQKQRATQREVIIIEADRH